MISLLEENLDAIRDLCGRFNVARLDVFGSALEENHMSESSDIDLLVEFLPGYSLGPWMSNYFKMKEELSSLLGRKVDLVMASSLKNAWLIREVNRTRKLLYAA